MSRSRQLPVRLAVFSLLLSNIALQACDSYTGTGDPVIVPDFAVALGSQTLQLAQSGTTKTFIKTTRSGAFTGAVTFAVTGAPAGLAVEVTTTNVADSSALTVTATATLATGSYPLVVTANGAGVPAKQANIGVTVTAAPPITAEAIRQVAVGAHTCALTTDGDIYCWGPNNHGQLGFGARSAIQSAPTGVVAGDLKFRSVGVSQVSAFSCALATGNVPYCWGDNSGGFLGDGTNTRRDIPTRVAGNLVLRTLSVGGLHACGVDFSQTVWCWGTSFSGALGDRPANADLTPVKVFPEIAFSSVVAGLDYTCGLDNNGHAYCWGRGSVGQLGNGGFTNSSVPVAVVGGFSFRALSAGGETVCGILNGTKAYCWGSNAVGTVGDGGDIGNAPRHLVPVAVAGGNQFLTLGAGHETVCGVGADEVGYCWGYNLGAIGDGTTAHRSSPTRVAGGLAFQSIASGTGYSCGISINEVLYCWGSNAHGELGDGTIEPRLTPTMVRWPTGIR